MTKEDIQMAMNNDIFNTSSTITLILTKNQSNYIYSKEEKNYDATTCKKKKKVFASEITNKESNFGFLPRI